MRLGFAVGYSGSRLEIPMDLVQEADRLGYYVCWTSEAYGSDAITPLAWIGAHTQQIRLGTAIMQMPARTPAMTAMTAMSLDALSGGRMVVGLGLSGPQVVEGWHGVAYGKPLVKTREYVEILRKIFAREEPLVHHGEHYTIPYNGADATGLGKPLRSILHARRDMPIYIASIGPKNVELTAEIADGWLPIFYSPERYPAYFKAQVDAGLERSGRSIAQFDIAPTVQVVLDDDLVTAYNQVRPQLALYIGGMGAKGKNFYHELAVRYGFEEAAETIQDLFLAGKKGDAMAAVPDELIDAVALVGSRERIRDRLQLWQQSEVTTLNVQTFDINVIRLMAELML